ncbi:MAG TPA: acetyl-CoA C-acetyltransferase [Ignavibacteriales bacterium]|nr:acetyl-CoA C-acetyltransferase [Ignavibacteriales bacterium]
MRKAVIVGAKRTPIGSFNGSLSSLSVAQLGGISIKSVLEQTGIDPSQVDEVIMGTVLAAAVGQAPARQAALNAGLPDKTECLTINKMCGSGLKSVMLAAQAVMCGDADIIVAGGQESMSNAPYALPKARNGYRLGHGTVIDTLISDGLWDVYNDIHMGSCAEKCVRDFNFSREDLDAYAIMSYERALNAQNTGHFDDEIIKVPVESRKGTLIVDKDEEPANTDFAKIPKLKPAFEKNGAVTAANASKINDGAAALIIMAEERAKELGLKPMAEIIAQSSAAKAPIDFTTAPADAITKVLKKSGLTIKDIGLFEINEAFAAVSLAVNKLLCLTPDNVNVNGGAIALGHPIGASGARILTTLLYEMKKRNTEFGLASLCIGGGEASALIVKNYN